MLGRPVELSGARDSMARWLRDDGTERFVPATTMCWFPRKPQRLRARREGFETVLRCGNCPGCREFERLVLQRRLVETYRSSSAASLTEISRSRSASWRSPAGDRPRLFEVTIDCGREIIASMIRGIRRWRGVEIEKGFVRAGADSLVVLSREPYELVARLERRKVRVHVRPVGRLDRARSWRHVARGMIVPRSAYGENINRWYVRGLAPRDKLEYEVAKLAEYKPFDRAKDPRATSEKLGTLVPNSLWKLPRGVAVRVRNLERSAYSPERVYQVLPELRRLVEGIGRRLVVSAVPKTTEELDRSRRAYQHVARISSARTDYPISENSSPPFLKGEVTELLDNSSSSIGRPMSSIHSSGAPPPSSRDTIRAEADAVEAAEKARTDQLDRKYKKQRDEAFARLLAHMEKAPKA